MCGRFAVTLPDDAMAQLFDAAPANDLPPTPNYNVCPTTPVHAVTLRDGRRRLEALRWGFLPHWYEAEDDGPLLINARAESVADKPAFRKAARERRCLIPADGFYEWTKDEAGNRLPWYITPPDGRPIAMAGIWRVWDKGGSPVATCAIITCPANRTIGRLHHRMPVVVAPEDWPLWLGEAGHGAARLMRPAPEEALTYWRVDRRVNSNRASGPDLIEPIGHDGADQG
jgi:putative SOS response-associated peptidase YedK